MTICKLCKKDFTEQVRTLGFSEAEIIHRWAHQREILESTKNLINEIEHLEIQPPNRIKSTAYFLKGDIERLEGITDHLFQIK